MGKAVSYYILALAIVLGLTYMASQAESCNKKPITSIHANDISADKENDEPVEDIEEADPTDEYNDATGRGSITSDEDADDDEVIPIEGDEEDNVKEGGGEIPADEPVRHHSKTTGDYLVIAGAFKSEANAKAEVRRLKGLGYPNAEIVEFDFSDYYSVCVAKYDSSSDAQAVADLIKSRSGKKAYVHRKRKKK
ncbi:MAG TPA: hypothetical protein ENJ53_04760 [Phaeodactylibacter sp.]|nr:hypothetical protein [Phaeodactylibacter sp.]